MRKIKKILKLDKDFRQMLFEAYFYLAWGRILKLIPFAKIAPTLGDPIIETTYTIHEEYKMSLAKISRAIYLMSRYTFWESECLVKAYAAMKMLGRRGIDCTLYLGTGKDESGKLVAHAWLRSGPYVITGKEGMERFTVVRKFAKYAKGSKRNEGLQT